MKGMSMRKRAATGNSNGSDGSQSPCFEDRSPALVVDVHHDTLKYDHPNASGCREESIKKNRGRRSTGSNRSHDQMQDGVDDESVSPLISVVESKRPWVSRTFSSLLLYVKSLVRDNRWSRKVHLFSAVVLCLVLTVFIVEKMVFVVRYATMGRPSFLYGSPSEWDDVKGCLSRSWRQDLIDYKAGISTTGNIDAAFLNPNVVWTWYRYSKSNTGTNHDVIGAHVAKRRLLIAQYSGFGAYRQILNEVVPVNGAYAQRWGHDFVVLEGTALRFPGLLYSRHGHNSTSTIEFENASHYCPNLENGYESQSTFNKIPLLFAALEKSASKQDGNVGYDQVLIMDTDTMIVDFDHDITTLLARKEQPDKSSDYQNENFLAAYRVWRNDWYWTWDVNAGITLWNLNHPATRELASTWLRKSLVHPKEVLLKNDDQFFLQRALISLGWWKRMQNGVRTVREEMEYYDGTVIKHFKRDARSWSRTSIQQRLLRIQEVKKTVCERWPHDCQGVNASSWDDHLAG